MELKVTFKSSEGKKRLTIYLEGSQEEVIETYQILVRHYKDKKFIVEDPA